MCTAAHAYVTEVLARTVGPERWWTCRCTHFQALDSRSYGCIHEGLSGHGYAWHACMMVRMQPNGGQ